MTQGRLRDQVVRRGLGVLQGARAFALLGTVTADALIACWRAKCDYAFWRPITAIRATDPGWPPLVQDPPYPDYTSGHACVSGAASNTFGELFGRKSLDLRVFSSVTSTTRTFETTPELDRETMNARTWLGIHFRRAMTDGNRLGHQVSACTSVMHETTHVRVGQTRDAWRPLLRTGRQASHSPRPRDESRLVSRARCEWTMRPL